MKTNPHQPAYSNMLPTLLVMLLVALPTDMYGVEPEPELEKWKIINYWSQWCAPCRIEIPILNELSKRLSSSNIIIVGINFDDDPRVTTVEIARAMRIEFPVLTPEEVAQLKLKAPDVLPTTYILSPNNEVVAKLVGQQSHQDLMEQLVDLSLLPYTDRQSGH